MQKIYYTGLFCITLLLCLTIGIKGALALDAPIITSPANNASFPMDDVVCEVTWTEVNGATGYCYALWDVTDGSETLLTGGEGRPATYGNCYIKDYHVEENHRYKLVVKAIDNNSSPVVFSPSEPVYFNVGIRKYNSEIVDYAIPATMDAGATYNVSITFKNTGSQTWTENNQDRLRISSEYAHFGITNNKITLGNGETVVSGATKTFYFSMTPDASGEYDIRLQMVHNDTQGFGKSKTVNVICNPSNNLPYDAKIINSNIPSDMKVGRNYIASITVQNTGQNAWSGNNVFALCPTAKNDYPNLVNQWISNEVVAVGATKTFDIPIKCDTAGNYYFEWQMYQNGIPFGEVFFDAFGVTVILPTSVSLDCNGIVMTLEDAPLQLVATVLPEDANNKRVEWWSSDTSVATVTKNGLVTPVGIGRASIWAESMADPEVYDICRVFVEAQTDITGITLSETKVIKQASDVPFQLFATISPPEATDKRVSWASSHPEIASVDSLGMVTPIRNGYTTITATSDADPSIYATCTVIIGTEDNSGPNVTGTSPYNNETNVALNRQTVTVNFDETIQAGSNYNSIEIICTTYNNAVVPLAGKGISGSTLTITRNGDWTKQNTYRVTIPAGAVKDAFGNNLPSNYVFSFSTTADSGTSITSPTITQPSTDGTTIALGVNGGFTVRWNTVSGAEHYVVAVKEEGASNYELMDDEVYTNEYSISYLKANLVAGHKYVIEVRAVRGSEITMNSRKVAVVTAAPNILTPNQTTVDINNIDVSWDGVWAGAAQEPGYKISFFDITANQAVANYTNKAINSTSFTLPASAAVENHQYRVTLLAVNNGVAGESSIVEFTVIKSSDTEKPYVVSTIPANGGKATVALGTLKVTFNENILTGPNISAITVARPGINSLGVTPSTKGEVLTLVISSSGAPFAAGYTYTATIPAGAVKDIAGNPSTAYQFSFTIDASGDGTAPYVVSSNPANGQNNVKPGQDIVITFSEPVDKKGPVLIGNTTYGDATGKTNQVLDATGKVLTISRNDGQSWEIGLTYTVTIPLGNITDISGNEMSGEYTFSFTISSDATAPTVVSTSPANGAVDVALNSAITITFSEPVSLVGNPYKDYKIEILNSTNNSPVFFQAVANDKKVTLTRGDGGQWNSNTQYTVKIHSSAVQDATGNTFTGNSQFSFTTVKIPASAAFTYYPSQPLTQQSVRFNASASQSGSSKINSYIWKFGDGSSATGVSPTHIYANAGQYTVELTLQLDDGSNKTTSKTISVQEPEANIEEVPGPQEEYIPVPGEVNPTTIKADQVIKLSDGRKQYSGNISINQYLKLDGNLIVDEVNLEMTGSGCLYIEATQGNFHGQIDLFKGDFTLNAETGELLKQLGINKLQIAGLNVEISSLRLLSNGVKVAGQLELPEFTGGSKIAINNLQVINNKVDYAGRIDLPTMKLGKSSLGLKNAYMEYDSTETKFVGHAILEIPKVFGIEGKIGLVNAQLNEVGFGLDGMNIAIDATGFFVNRLYGELGGLAQPPLKITGQADITGGPKVLDVAAIEGKNLTLTVDMSGNFGGSGDLKLFSFDLAAGKFDLDKNKGFSIQATLNAMDIVEANLTLKCDKSLHLQGVAQGNIHVPKNVPWIGGMEVSDAQLSIHDAGINADIEQGILKVGFWMKWNGQFGVSGRMTLWDANKSPQLAMLDETAAVGKDSIMIAAETSPVVVPSGQSQSIIRLTWEEDADTDFSLSGPNGESLTPVNCPIDSLTANYFKNTDQKEAFYVIANPAAGSWTYTISNPAVTLYKVEIYQVDDKPALTITSPNQDTLTSGSLAINWNSNAASGALLSLYYGKDNQQTTGTLVAGELDPASGGYTWDTSNIQNGDYYIYAIVDDDCNDPVIAWATGKITVQNLAAPAVPQGLAAEAINGYLNISWNPNSEADLEGYRIYLLDAQDQPMESAFVSLDHQSFEWNGLEANQTYRIAVCAVNDSKLESYPSQVVEVFLPQAIPPALSITWPAIMNSQAEVTVTGEIENGATGVLLLNGTECATGISGSFEQAVELTYGRNEMLLVATKVNGDAAQETFECYYDPTPPQLTVNNLTQEMESKTSSLEVSGTVEPSAALYLNDTQLTINPDGTFFTTLNLQPGYNNLYLQAQDEAGNRTIFNSIVLFAGDSIIYGDANKDSNVNITDAVLVLKYITNPEQLIDAVAADVNGDGSINITDAVLILKHITSPDTPFPVEL